MPTVLEREREREARRQRWLEKGLGRYREEANQLQGRTLPDQQEEEEEEEEEDQRPPWNAGKSSAIVSKMYAERNISSRLNASTNLASSALVSSTIFRGATKVAAKELVRKSLCEVDDLERCKPLYKLLEQLGSKADTFSEARGHTEADIVAAAEAGMNFLDIEDIDAENTLRIPTGLELTGRDSDSSVSILADALSQCGCSMDRLEFCPGVKHDPRHVACLLDALSCTSEKGGNKLPARFSSIILSQVGLHDGAGGGDAVAKFVRDCDEMTTEIDVSWNSITEIGMIAICSAILSRSHVSIHYSRDDDNADTLDEEAAQPQFYKYALDLSYCTYVAPSALISNVSRLLPALHSLRIAGAGISGEDNCRSLAKSLARYGEGLVRLDLSGNGLGPRGIDLIARGLGSLPTNSLEELDLSRTTTVIGTGGAGVPFLFPSDTITKLAASTFQRLQTLRLADNGITARDVGLMIGWSQKDELATTSGGLAACHALQILDLSENLIGESSSDEEKLGRRRLLRWLALDECLVRTIILDDNCFTPSQKLHFEKSLRKRCGHDRWDRLEVHMFHSNAE